jgi:diaminohydroxyphosphoribosylaminopyrimidine deaminase/5-amino-6-(5-phosphoribosylamino)uracil reductase
MALRAAGERARGATMYVTLEPCCHTGRTPPCTDAIVEAGIARVVIGSDDPSAKAAGRGPGILRDEGIRVDFAEEEVARVARLLNQPFRKHSRTGRPHVLLKTAMSLDGRVATGTGDSKWISGEFSRARAHRWRGESDAVAVGIGTALADDPELTARVEGVFRQPRRIVFDSEGRLPPSSKLMRSAGETPVIVICSRAAPRRAIESFAAAGAEVIVIAGGNPAQRVAGALDELGAREIQSILLEGGPQLAGSFLDAGEVDEMRVFIAPIVLGGREAKPAIEGEGAAMIARAPRAISTEVEQIGDDVLISSRLKEW